MQQKGKLVDAFRSEDYKPEKLISPIRESTFRMMLEANLYDIDLQGAWDSKMRIRYGRDGDRFQQTP